MAPGPTPELADALTAALEGAIFTDVALVAALGGGGLVLGRKLQAFVSAKLSAHLANPQMAKLAGQAARVLVSGGAILTALAQLGVDLTVFLTLIGSVWISIGFALQSNLSHLVSGLMLQVLSPMRPGDRIEANGYEGQVVEIGAFATTLRTAEGGVLRIPNSELTGKPLVVLGEAFASEQAVQLGTRAHCVPDQVRDRVQDLASALLDGATTKARRDAARIERTEPGLFSSQLRRPLLELDAACELSAS